MSDPAPESVSNASPEPDVRGARWLRRLERAFLYLDQLFGRLVPGRLNPLHHMGGIANAMLVVALVSGGLLLFWYVPSADGAWESLEAMKASPWSAQLMRSLHRYSSDAAIFFVLLHGLRILFERRFSGPRWLGWVTGVVLLGVLWLTGWTGYWLVWDVRAQVLAEGTAEMLDLLPVFVTPLTRTFLAQETLSSALFFTVFFVHLVFPLLFALGLWLHISRVRRSKFFPPGTMVGWMLVALIVVSVLDPAYSAAPADPGALPSGYTMDWWYLLPTIFFERLSGGALWGLTFVAVAVAASVPWSLVAGEIETAELEPKYCNACARCAADCPYRAIDMVARAEEHPRHDLEARIDPAKCVGCGICAGACEPGGVGIPALDVRTIRHKIDDWLEDHDGDEPPYIAFACSESAGADLEVDRESGRCDALPDYRVVPVPCIGWVSPLTVERALRKGAPGVLLTACSEEGPHYREGAKWMQRRLQGDREPELRTSMVDSERVELVDYNRTETSGFLDRARQFARPDDDGGERSGEGSRWRRIAGGVATAAVLSIPVVGLSDLPGWSPYGDDSRFVVSLDYSPPVEKTCEELSDEQKAELPEHMRVDERCERRRPPVQLRVRIDDQPVLDRTYDPPGISGDGVITAVETMPLDPGRHDIQVEMFPKDSAEASRHRWAETFRAENGRREVLLFRDDAGFYLVDDDVDERP